MLRVGRSMSSRDDQANPPKSTKNHRRERVVNLKVSWLQCCLRQGCHLHSQVIERRALGDGAGNRVIPALAGNRGQRNTIVSVATVSSLHMQVIAYVIP